jgi:hypothetical protein
MKTAVSTLFILSIATVLFAQQETTYPHCNCTELLSESGAYTMTCDGVEVEFGNYIDGKKDGLWTTTSNKGVKLSAINYADGKLHGNYLLFSTKGYARLIASFQNGLKDGDWQFFSDKGKVIKQGKYALGKPVGEWKIYDKKGKALWLTYDFDNPGANKTVLRYYGSGGTVQDDPSGEWMIMRSINGIAMEDVVPLGGHLLASDYFVDFLNIPTVFMNTYAKFDFVAKLKLENGAETDLTIMAIDKNDINPKTASFPFVFATNDPRKLSSVKHNEQSIEFLRERMLETLHTIGPWVTQSNEPQEIYIHIPFVLNLR